MGHFLGWLHAAQSQGPPEKASKSRSPYFGLLSAAASSKSSKDRFNPHPPQTHGASLPTKDHYTHQLSLPVSIVSSSPLHLSPNERTNPTVRLVVPNLRHHLPQPRQPVGESETPPPRPLPLPPATPPHRTAMTHPNLGHRPLGSPSDTTVTRCASPSKLSLLPLPSASVRALRVRALHVLPVCMIFLR